MPDGQTQNAPRKPLPMAPRRAASASKSIGSHLEEFRKIILNTAFLAVVGLLLLTAIKVLRSDDMVIDAIGLPKNIKELGYSEDGAALILSDNIKRIREAAKTDDTQLSIKAKFEEVDVAVAVEGLSFGFIIRLLRQTFGLPQNRLIGDFVCPSEPCLSSNMELRLRLLQGTGTPEAFATIKGASHDAILQTAAERFMEKTSPMALTLHLYNSGPERKAEAMALAQRIAATNNGERLAALNLIGVELLERPEKRPEDLKAAITYFQRMLEEDSSIAMAYTNWGAALSGLGDKQGAIAKYRQAIALDPSEAQQQHNLGVVLADQGQAAEAIAAFQQAVALDPNAVSSYIGLAAVQLKAGDATAAVASYEKAIAISPDIADIHFNLGDAANKAGKPLLARSAFETYLRLNPEAADRATVQGYIDAFTAQLQQ